MKIRIQGNTIRFRLNRREVDQFAEGGLVEAHVEFPLGERLSYSVERSGNGQMDAKFEAGRIRVSVPEHDVAAWSSTDQIGIQGSPGADAGKALEVIIEKDFQCMHKGEEGKDPDAFPNPLA